MIRAKGNTGYCGSFDMTSCLMEHKVVADEEIVIKDIKDQTYTSYVNEGNEPHLLMHGHCHYKEERILYIMWKVL